LEIALREQNLTPEESIYAQELVIDLKNSLNGK